MYEITICIVLMLYSEKHCGHNDIMIFLRVLMFGEVLLCNCCKYETKESKTKYFRIVMDVYVIFNGPCAIKFSS
jgi:hypothetical protein